MLTAPSDIPVPQLLRVKFLSKGRGLAGWDCVGLCLHMTQTYGDAGVRTAFAGVDFLDAYGGTARADAPEMEAAISARLSQFAPCAPQRGAWLLFKVFGVTAHVGWALNAGLMLHADDAPGGRGATYCERFDQGAWKRRLVGAYLPVTTGTSP